MENKEMESELRQAQEAKRRKRMKLVAAFFAAFVVFHVIIILVFVMVVMKFRTPKYRIGNGVDILGLSIGSQSSPSFNMSFAAPIRIKNTNFGPYKYDTTTMSFTYGGVQVGQVRVPKSKANFRSTKKVDVIVSVNSSALTSTSGLRSELKSGVLTISCQGKLEGKVELMFIFKKKKSTNMNCSMAIDVSSKKVQSVSCK